jgi:hypothetical protein
MCTYQVFRAQADLTSREPLIGTHCGIPHKQKAIPIVITPPTKSVYVTTLTVTEASFCCALFCVFMASVRYNSEQKVVIYDSYVGGGKLYMQEKTLL